MYAHKIKILILSLLTFLCFLGKLPAQDSETLRLIQEQYQSITSFEGQFIQISHRSDQESGVQKATGKVSYKRPGKMRWTYETPEEQLLITNGKILWLFDPLLENVTIQSMEKITDGTALSFLLGVGDLRTDFTLRETSRDLLENVEGLLVELEPRKETANLAFIQLEVHPETHDLKKIILMDQQDNYRIIALENMSYNMALPDSDFVFEVTPDMEVIQPNN